MSCFSLARSCISLAIRKNSRQFNSQGSWNQCCFSHWRSDIKSASVSMTHLGSLPPQSRVHCYSTRTKAGRSKKQEAVPIVDREQDAFFIVRKGDLIGIYKNLSDCQAQVGSSVCDPPVSVYKGYSMPKEAEESLSSLGLKNPIYSIRASDLKEDMFGILTPCRFQEPMPSNVETPEETSSDTMSRDQIETKKREEISLASISVESLKKLEPPAEPHAAAASEQMCLIEFDGASKGNPGLSGAAAVLRNVDGSLICKLRQGLGIATNNSAEYQGMILGLKHAVEKGYKNIRVKGDSKLVCMQMKGLWKVKHEKLAEMYKEAKELSDKCISFEISHVLRANNSEADEQANLAVRLSEGEVQEE